MDKLLFVCQAIVTDEFFVCRLNKQNAVFCISADEDNVIQSKAPERASKWTMSGDRFVNSFQVIQTVKNIHLKK